jgi:hypothetical protein
VLSFVCHQLAVVRYPVALVGDPVSSPRLKFTSSQVCLALGEGTFALIEFVSPALQLRGRLDTVFGGHNSP